MMTNEQKIEALTDLLSNVIHSLEMTKYEIEDVSEAANVIREANNYDQQMLDILHSDDEDDKCFGTHLTEQQGEELDAYLDTLN